MRKLYLVGSLRNPAVPLLASQIRKMCPEVVVFDDWFAAGPEADDCWKAYEQGRYGTDSKAYVQGLKGEAAEHVFQFDKKHLDTSSHVLLVLPAGKSGHMEIMYAAYHVKARTAILLEEGVDPRWDVMYKFIPDILTSVTEVRAWIERDQLNDSGQWLWRKASNATGV